MLMQKRQDNRRKETPLRRTRVLHARARRTAPINALRCREGRRCRLQRHLAQAMSGGANLLSALRWLRRDLVGCAHCPLEGGCPALNDFNQIVNLAIEQINAEWERLAEDGGEHA